MTIINFVSWFTVGPVQCAWHTLVRSPWETHSNGQDKPSLQLGGDALESLLDCPNSWTNCRPLIYLQGTYDFDGAFSNKRAQGLSSVSFLSVYEQIMLWHLRLRHLGFLYLKHLFPTLFKGLDCSSFYCESFYLSKSHRTTYYPKPYVPWKPFNLIHSDVWDFQKLQLFLGKKNGLLHRWSYMFMLGLFDEGKIRSWKTFPNFL